MATRFSARLNAWFWVVLTAGIVLRVALFLLVPHVLVGDALHNIVIAANLLSGHGYSHSPVPPFYPDTQRPPLYSLYLMPGLLAGAPVQCAVAGQIAMDAAVIWMMWCLMPATIGPLAATLFALSPYEGLWSTMLLSETMATALVTAWVCLAVYPTSHWGRWVGMGALGAMAALCRTALLPLPLLGIIVAATPHREWKRAVISTLIFVACLLPWVFRNAADVGLATPTTAGNFGPTLYLGLAYDVKPPLLTDGQDLFQTYLGQWRRASDVPTDEVMDINRKLASLCLSTIQQHPAAYLVSILQRTERLWCQPDDGVESYSDATHLVEYKKLNNLAMWMQQALVVLAVLGLMVRARHWRELWPWLALVAGLTLVYAPVHVEPRFMLPAQPALCLMAAWLVRKPS